MVVMRTRSGRVGAPARIPEAAHIPAAVNKYFKVHGGRLRDRVPTHHFEQAKPVKPAIFTYTTSAEKATMQPTSIKPATPRVAHADPGGPPPHMQH